MNASTDWMSLRGQKLARVYLSKDDVQWVSANAAATQTGQQPLPWQEAAVERLMELTRLRDNWDSYGARAPTWQAGHALLGVLAAVMRPTTPIPSIVPSPLGHFQAEWHVNASDLEIEVISPTNVRVAYSDGISAPWERFFDIDFTRLVAVVARLA